MNLYKFVISMKDSKRKDIFLSQKYGAEFDIFEATDGKDASKCSKFDAQAFKNKYGVDPLPGEIGCSISHFRILEKFISTALPGDFLLVAEDDAVFVENASQVVDNIINKIPYLDVVILGHPYSPGGYLKRASIDERIKRPSYIGKFVGKAYEGKYKVATFDGEVWGTGLYLIGYNSAKRYVDYVNNIGKIYWRADDWIYISSVAEIKLRTVSPTIVGWQGGSEIRDDSIALMQTAHKVTNRKIREKIAIRYRLKYFPRSVAATLRDVADLLAKQ